MNEHADETPSPTQPALVVTYGRTARKVRPLERDLVVIGQGRGSDVSLGSPEIADGHCVLFRTPEGWRLRDCGSRIGTRLNGKAVHESVLCDGDVLQVGTFTFRMHMPPAAPAAEAGARERRLQRSRRHLARLALALRRRLHQQRPETAADPGQADVDRQLAVLRERLREYEQRAQRLHEAERELAADRARVEQAERALAQRRGTMEAELRLRRAECEERCRELGRQHAETRDLDRRRRELDCYARHLLRMGPRAPQESGELAAELEELRAENLRLRHLLAQREPAVPAAADPEAAARLTGQIEELRAELAAARRAAEEKEAQVQRLLTARPVIDPTAEGMDVESYEAQLAEFCRQLQEDRRGVNKEIRLLRERTVELDEAARAMEQRLAQEQERLTRERAELDRLREEVFRQLGQAAPDAVDGLAVVRRFKETMAALTGWQPGQPTPAGKGGSNGRGYRARAPRRGNGSGSVPR
jgi:hypothetical protein